MNHFGLKAEQFDILSNIFGSNPNVHSIYIYGSRAMGTNKDRSDVDLVLMDKNIDRFSLGNLIFEINNSDFPFTVDIQNFNTLKNPDLIKHIQTYGKLFYSK